MAKPNADSVAATVKINKTNNCPIISSRYIEKIIKFKLIDKINSSIATSITIKFFLFKIIPKIPIRNSKRLKINKKLKFNKDIFLK